MTQSELIEMIKADKVYGCGRADLNVPMDLRDIDFGEFGAFIVRRGIPNDQIGTHMQEFIKKSGRKMVPPC